MRVDDLSARHACMASRRVVPPGVCMSLARSLGARHVHMGGRRDGHTMHGGPGEPVGLLLEVQKRAKAATPSHYRDRGARRHEGACVLMQVGVCGHGHVDHASRIHVHSLLPAGLPVDLLPDIAFFDAGDRASLTINGTTGRVTTQRDLMSSGAAPRPALTWSGDCRWDADAGGSVKLDGKSCFALLNSDDLTCDWERGMGEAWVRHG